MKVRRYEAGDAPAIARLAARLAAGGAPWPLYPEGAHDTAPGPVTSRLFVAADDGEIRGSVWLREHEFWLGGRVVRAGWAKYPVAESLVDPRFGGVPGALILRLLREQPYLMALGMGGEHAPFARLLRGMGWAGGPVPFYVLPVRPARVMRHLRHLRRTATRRLALDLLALSGIGWLGWRALELARTGGRSIRGCPYVLEASFGPWADEAWLRFRSAYGLVARRDAPMLNLVLPATLPVERLRLRQGGAECGWVCVLQHQFGAADGSPFGTLRVGLVADGLTDPASAAVAVATATDHLRRAGVDLVFGNHTHPAWGRAFRARGFVQAPSQFAFYRSPRLEGVLDGARPGDACVNRGDCDGPVFW